MAELINDNVNDNDNENLRAGVMLSNAKHLAQCNEDKSLSETNCEILRDAQDDKHNVKQCAEQYKISFVAINEYYKRLTGCDYDEKYKNATRIIELVGGAVRVTLSPKRIAIAMQRLGYEQRRVLNTRGWNVVILTGDQIKEQQRMDAHRSVEE